MLAVSEGLRLMTHRMELAIRRGQLDDVAPPGDAGT
jgi:hypothetical protein